MLEAHNSGCLMREAHSIKALKHHNSGGGLPGFLVGGGRARGGACSNVIGTQTALPVMGYQ